MESGDMRYEPAVSLENDRLSRGFLGWSFIPHHSSPLAPRSVVNLLLSIRSSLGPFGSLSVTHCFWDV